MPDFVHLHVHSEFSLLDGACRVDRLLDAVKDAGMSACAITDHGVMYGVVDFYQKAVARGIHPVIGCEVYTCADRFEKQSAAREYNHLILLCENQVGYHNLMQLVSAGFTQGFYYKPRIDMALLREHHEGLIALSACLSGEIPSLLLSGQPETARTVAREMRDLFGPGRYFIEIQDHGMADQRTVLPQLVRLARELDIPLVATNDVHYLRREDAQAQEVLMCIQTGKTLEDEQRMRMDTDQLYLKTPDEMAALFPQWPEALQNAADIAARCEVSFDFNTIHLPVFPLPEGTDAYTLLQTLCEQGRLERYPADDTKSIERMRYELDMIHRMGYVDYFLIVWDYVRFAKEKGILVGPGRGSGAASIAAYCLGITGLEPMQYNLLFERFLNPERLSMPDFDIDFCYERRQEVIDYVVDKYGADHVSQIITFGTMAARAVVRDVGRVLGYSYAEVDQIAKMIPFALGITLEQALELNPELRKACDEDPRIARLMEISRALEGMPRHASTHAAGVLVTERPVSDYVPLQKNDDVITTQFPMTTLESLGLLKMDFLGLRTLTVLRDTLALLQQAGIELTLEGIPMDDPAVYSMISAGDTDGVFQLESGGMRTFLTNMQPGCFEDIIAAVSLYRPGPMDSIPRYIAGKKDPESVEYLHPKLKPILDVTYGCMVYQEQIMQIVRDLAGYSLGRSDLMRRAMSKKKKDVMAKERDYFIHGLIEDGKVIVPGAVRLGMAEPIANQIFDEMSSFASYAFNKPHAAAYAMISIQTAYLKLYYPVQFMAALMNSAYGNTGKIAGYIQYCRKHSIPILPPHVNHSQARFSVDKDASGVLGIRFGMGAVKNAGQGAVQAIVDTREKGGLYRDIFDFVRRADADQINKRMVESLIRAGAFDGLGANRAQLLGIYETAMDGATQERRRNVAGQVSLFGELLEDTPPALPRLHEHAPLTLLAMEKEVTGIYITGHPLDEYRELLEGFDCSTQFIRELDESPEQGLAMDGLNVTIGGILTGLRTKATKAGQLMAFLTLEDLTGEVECLVFPKTYERLQHRLSLDEALAVSGRLSVREEEETKLLVSDVVPLARVAALPREEAPRSAERLHLRVSDTSQMHALLPLLAQYSGTMPVCFHLIKEKKTVLPERPRCDGSANLLEQLTLCIGADNIKKKPLIQDARPVEMNKKQDRSDHYA